VQGALAGEAVLALLEGPAGIGKSSLLAEARARALHIAVDVNVAGEEIRGHVCEGVQEPKPFSGWLGLIGALDALLGTTDTQHHRQARERRRGETDRNRTA
jgi:hypothetical protein